jgi:hypothetical protein
VLSSSQDAAKQTGTVSAYDMRLHLVVASFFIGRGRYCMATCVGVRTIRLPSIAHSGHVTNLGSCWAVSDTTNGRIYETLGSWLPHIAERDRRITSAGLHPPTRFFPFDLTLWRRRLILYEGGKESCIEPQL